MKLTARRIGGVTPFRPKENMAGMGKSLRQDTLSLAKAVLLRHGEGGGWPFPAASMVLLLLEQKEKLDHAWQAVQLLTVLNRMEVYQMTNPMYRQIFNQLNTQIRYELTRACGLMGKEVKRLEQVFENLKSEDRQRQDKTLRAIRKSLLERSRLYEKSTFFHNRIIKTSAAPLPNYKEIWRQSVAFCQPARDLAAYLENLKPENQKEIAGFLGSTREELFQKLYQMRQSDWERFAQYFKSRLTYIDRLQESRELLRTEQLEEAVGSLTAWPEAQPEATALKEIDTFNRFIQLFSSVREDSRKEEALQSFIEYVSYGDTTEWDKLVERIYQHSSEDWLSREFVSMTKTASFQEYKSLSQEERLKEKNTLLLLLEKGDSARLADFFKKLEQSQSAAFLEEPEQAQPAAFLEGSEQAQQPVFPKEPGQISLTAFLKKTEKGPLADFLKMSQYRFQEDSQEEGETLQAFMEYVSYSDSSEWDRLVQSMYQHFSEDWLSRQFVSMAETSSFREYEKLSQMERLQEKRVLLLLLQEIRKIENLNQTSLAASTETLEQSQVLSSLEKRVDELQLHWRLARYISKMDTKTRLFLGEELPVLYEGKREEIFRFLEENSLSGKTLNRIRLMAEVNHMELSQWDAFMKAVYKKQEEDETIREFVNRLEVSSFEEYQEELPGQRMERKQEFFTFLQQMEKRSYEGKYLFSETDSIWKEFAELIFYSQKSRERFSQPSEGFLETLSEPYSSQSFMKLISDMELSQWDRLVKAMYEQSPPSWIGRQFTAMVEAAGFQQYETLSQEERLYEKNVLLLLLKEGSRTDSRIPVYKRIEEMELRWRLARQISRMTADRQAVFKQLLQSEAFREYSLESGEKEEIFRILTEDKQSVQELKHLESLVYIAEARTFADGEHRPFTENLRELKPDSAAAGQISVLIQLASRGTQPAPRNMQPESRNMRGETRNTPPEPQGMRPAPREVQTIFQDMRPVSRETWQKMPELFQTGDRVLPETNFDYQPAHMVITPGLPPNPRFSPSVPRGPDGAGLLEEGRKGNEGEQADIAITVRKTDFITATGEYQKQMKELTFRLEEQQKQLEQLKSGQAMLVKKTSTEELTVQVLNQLQSQLRLEKMRRGL